MEDVDYEASRGLSQLTLNGLAPTVTYSSEVPPVSVKHFYLVPRVMQALVPGTLYSI